MSCEQKLGVQTLDLVKKLLALQLANNKFISRMYEQNVTFPPEAEFDATDLIADLCGVRADNTVETDACTIANVTGVWPVGAYCRDWIWDSWQEVVRGESSIESFIEALCAEGNAFASV
jgi:hypothetical protein